MSAKHTLQKVCKDTEFLAIIQQFTILFHRVRTAMIGRHPIKHLLTLK